MGQLPITATYTSRVIFHGTPSQIVNLPRMVVGATTLLALAALFWYGQKRWALQWGFVAIPAIWVIVVMVIACLRTAFTEIIIDAERITFRRGIFNRQVSSLELFRILDVTSIHPWWQRVFGVGTVVVMTSDSNYPVWRLPGIVNAEQMRNGLNRAAITLRDQKGIREVNMGRV